MKAYACRKYGDPPRLEEVPTPTPGRGQALVRILATTVTAGDWRTRTLELPRGFGPIGRPVMGFRGPRKPILGAELAGVVERVGEGVTRFAPGDAVLAATGATLGAHAEYALVAASGAIVPKPRNLTFEEAAALPFGGVTALHFLAKAQLRAGERLAVVGASGNVGTALVQLGKRAGARVTGVTSARNAELVASLGADEIVDYAKDDYAAGREYDVIADTVGETPASRALRALRPKGRLLLIACSLSDLIFAPARAAARGKRAITGVAWETPEAMQELARLAEAGAIRPVIDRRYEFAELPEAHEYVATRRKRGSVVVRVADGAQERGAS